MAVELVRELHGNLIRSICRATGCHYQGLTVASRAKANGMYIFSPATRRRLVEVDHAYHVCEHITEPSCRSFLSEVEAAVVTPTPSILSLDSLVPANVDVVLDPCDVAAQTVDSLPPQADVRLLRLPSPARTFDLDVEDCDICNLYRCDFGSTGEGCFAPGVEPACDTGNGDFSVKPAPPPAEERPESTASDEPDMDWQCDFCHTVFGYGDKAFRRMDRHERNCDRNPDIAVPRMIKNQKLLLLKSLFSAWGCLLLGLPFDGRKQRKKKRKQLPILVSRG
mmetsp:Transcript_113130/g.330676  ORF Transcript_113130/g.330676 Transcript_113130/m.330676 type:complete len:280 (-) Transcript_113130:312-1151(-)